jgi:hypothetical protein
MSPIFRGLLCGLGVECGRMRTRNWK